MADCVCVCVCVCVCLMVFVGLGRSMVPCNVRVYSSRHFLACAMML